MGRNGKTFTVILFLIFALMSAQNAQALGPDITLNSTEITQVSVSFSWKQPDFFATSYTLYMSTASNYVNGHPFTPIWSTSDRNQTTTTVSNLTPFSDYYFYILASGGGGAVSSNLIEVRTLPNPSFSPNLTSTPSPTVPELPYLAIVLLFVSLLSVAIVLRYRKAKYG